MTGKWGVAMAAARPGRLHRSTRPANAPNGGVRASGTLQCQHTRVGNTSVAGSTAGMSAGPMA